MSSITWVILAILNLPVFFLIGRMFFPTIDDFWEAIRFWLTPDWLSAFRGEFIEDMWEEMKLFIWLAICGLLVFAEGQAFVQLFHP